MKHTSHACSYQPRLNQLTKQLLVVLFPALMLACKKDYLPVEPVRQVEQSINVKKKLILESIVLNDSVVRLKCQNNLKQIAVAIHNYDDGSFKKELAYEYDRQGRLIKTNVKGEGHYEYEYDSRGKIIAAAFYNNQYSSLTPIRTFEFDHDGVVDGRDFLVWQRGPTVNDSSVVVRHYYFNPNGTPKSIEVYEGFAKNIVLTGKVIIENNGTPAQVASWLSASEYFMEPEKPWDILTMLSTRIEMHGTGTIGDEKIVDGKIITATKREFNKDGYLIRKEVNRADTSRPHPIHIESFSWGTTNY